MASKQLRDLVATLPNDGDLALRGLTAGCAEVVGVTGSGIMLMTDDVQRGSLRTSDDVSATIEDLQFEFEEGPCVDAYHQQHAILEPDLEAPKSPRWSAFTPAALTAGVRAIFGFPLTVGEIRLGSLNLYRDEPGALRGEQEADALRVADLIAIEMLSLQAEAESGEVAAALSSDGDLQDRVHQACGIVAVQLEIRPDRALRMLRAYSVGTGKRLRAVADAVVDHTLRLGLSGTPSRAHDDETRSDHES
jgi:GAF domain-containing protein